MLTLVIGGIRSGKSATAVELAAAGGGKVLVLATGVVSDPEMAARVAAHRARRPAGWSVREEPLDLGGALAGTECDTVLLDALDTWVANRMEAAGGATARFERSDLERMEAECRHQLDALLQDAPSVVAVSSEVGHSLVAVTHYGRAFTDVLGSVNQHAAARAARVVLVVAGIPVTIRDAGNGPR